jgi:hypothetical protein
VHRVAKINRLGMGVGDGLAVDGAAQGLRALVADPLATDKTLQDLGHGVLPLINQEGVIASEARQSMDRHVASLLAMTEKMPKS